jgi:hypothetical protein
MSTNWSQRRMHSAKKASRSAGGSLITWWSALGERVVRRVRQGKSVSVLGRADRLHTWSFTGDVAAILVTAGTDPRAWGRA